MTALRLLFAHLDQFRTRFYWLFLAGFLDGAVLFFIPLLLSEYTKSAITAERVIAVSTLVGICFCVSLGLEWMLRRHGEALSASFTLHLRLKYFRRVEALPAQQLMRHHSGYLLSLVGQVASGIGGLANEMFWGIAKSLSNMLLFFAFTARESLLIACLNTALLLIFVFVSAILSKRMVPISTELTLSQAAFSERFVDLLSNVITVKKLGVFENVFRWLKDRSDLVDSWIVKLQRFHANRWFLLHSLFGFSFLATIIAILWGIAHGQTSPAVLVLFVGVFGIVRNQIERLSEDYKMLLELGAVIKQLESALDSPPSHSGSTILGDWKELTFSQIAFSHREATKVIRIPSFRVQKNEIISVRGASGEGKTTLLNLLGNFIAPLEGQRAFDGVPFEQLAPNTFRDHFCYVSQEVELFHMSLRDNIALGRPITDEALQDLFGALDLLPWLLSLPDGLDSLVGEKGLRLSSGQKQRVNLLRALTLDREILLLDEPTAHLDQETEALVVEFLRQHLAGRTAVIVSHRPALKSLCSRSYIMRSHTLHEEHLA